MGFEGLPIVMAWELTLACNLRCLHCGSAADFPRRNELTLEEALSLCDQFPDLLVQEVDFTGGQPLVRSDWAEIARRLIIHGIRTQIISNGLLLNAETAALMKDVGIAQIGISLDGLEKTHEYIRNRKGLFNQARVAIENVQKSGIPVAVITTVNALNLSELPALLEYVRGEGVKHWQIQPIFPLGRSRDNAELQLTEADYIQLGKFAEEWVPKTSTSSFTIDLGDSLGYATKLDPRELPWCGCPAGLVSCGITSDGKVKGCLSLPDTYMEGDLRETKLWDIWFRPDAFAYTRSYTT